MTFGAFCAQPALMGVLMAGSAILLVGCLSVTEHRKRIAGGGVAGEAVDRFVAALQHEARHIVVEAPLCNDGLEGCLAMTLRAFSGQPLPVGVGVA